MSRKSKPINRLTEYQANQLSHDKRGASRLDKPLEEVFRTELAILLEEGRKERDLSIVPAVPEAGQDARFFIGVYEQNKAYILDRMEARLKTRRYWIQQYLAQVDEIIRTKLARGEVVNALPYTNLQALLPKPEAKKRGKKRAIKRGKKRSYTYKGETYPSIRQAALAHPDETSYNTLKSQAYRELKRENSI